MKLDEFRTSILIMAPGGALFIMGVALVAFGDSFAPAAHYLLLLPALSAIAYLTILDKLRNSQELEGEASRTLVHLKD